MTSDPSRPAVIPNKIIGLAALTHGAYAGVDLQPIWAGLVARARTNPYDAGALMDIGCLLQLTGRKEPGLESQHHALELCRVYERSGAPGGLKILAIVMPGDFMANTPLDFLLEGSDATLYHLYMGTGEALADVPDHDVAFVAIGQSDASQSILKSVEPMVARWPRPVLNRNIQAIKAMGRDQVAASFAGSSTVWAPKSLRVTRSDLERLAAGEQPVSTELANLSYPLIVRPVGSHAGESLERIASAAALTDYLETFEAAEAYVAAFVDYSSPDGLYRKYRVALIDGVPFISHLAISSHWMVHYLNAGMGEDEVKRAEEAEAMRTFDSGFAVRHSAAFAEIHAKIPLDYFAIDCAEGPDGRLLLFEADVAMIVHSMDDPEVFPYKGPQMTKLFSAFHALLARNVKR